MNECADSANERPSETGRLMTKDEVATMLRKSRRTIEHWVDQGYISCIRIGRSVLFDRQQILKDLKRFETQSTGTMLGL